jgi:hypothetical protein
MLMLGLLFPACGGRAHRADTDSSTGDGGRGGAIVSGTSGKADPGTKPGEGGATSDAVGGTGGLPDSISGAAGVAPDTTVSVGDIDHPPPGLGSAPTDKPSFFWGSSDKGYRIGNWFVVGANGTVHDAMIDALDPPRGDSTLACHVNGAAFADAVDLYAQLDHPSSRPVDLNAYSGLAFWARLSPPTAKLVVALNIEGAALLSEESVSGLVSASFPAAQNWQHFELPFVDASRTSSVVSIDFVVLGGGDAVDLWIDELSLLCRGACR